MMKSATLICFALFFLGVALFLAQMWLSLFSPELFGKIIVTIMGLFAIVFIWAFLKKESRDSAKIDRNSLD
jgi:hypothetical protein